MPITKEKSTDLTLEDIDLSSKEDVIGPSNRVNASHVGANGSVSNTEYGYLDGVSSPLQAQLNALSAISLNNRSNTLMIYPTTAYWGFTSFEYGGHDIQVNLRYGALEIKSQNERTYYVSLNSQHGASTGGTESASSSTTQRVILNSNSYIRVLSFNTLSDLQSRIIISAYGGTPVETIIINFNAVRHDSDEVLVIAESYSIPV